MPSDDDSSEAEDRSEPEEEEVESEDAATMELLHEPLRRLQQNDATLTQLDLQCE